MKRLTPFAFPLLLAGCIVVEPPPAGPDAAPPPSVVVAPPPVAAPAPTVIETSPPPPTMAPAPAPVYVAPPPPVVVVEQPPIPDREVVVVYEDLLGRRPSEHEVWEWRERSRHGRLTPDDIRRELRESGEYRALAPETVIRRAFLDFHHREPDLDDMRFYRRRMIDDGWTPGQIRQAIAHREEPHDRAADRGPRVEPNRHEEPADDDRRRGPNRGAGEWEANSPHAIIDRAYEDLLERKPDAAGRERYSRLLAQGQSEAQIRAQIKQSVEYRVTLPDSKTTRAYREVLGRDPDPVGLEGFRHKIVDQGWTEEDVKNYLRQTAEYKNRHR